METTAPQGFFGRLGGLLGPQGLTPEEQAQLGRSGLLQAGLGILANNHDRYNAGAAVGSGLLAGVSAMQKGGEDALDRKLKAEQVMRMGGDPATFRAMDMQARAAGYEPGSEGYQNFFKRANGELARASSAGYSFDTVDDNGYPRPQRRDPRSGGVEMFYAEQNRWVPLGSVYGGAPSPAAPAPASTVGATFTTSTGEPFDVSQVADPVLRAQITANPEAWGMAPDGAQAQIPPQNVATFTPAPVPGLGRGRRKEDEAAAVEQAKANVELANLPTKLNMQTEADIARSRGVEQAKSEQERASNERAKTAQLNNVDRGLTRIDEALKSLSGRLVDTGPIDGRLMVSTQQGQELEAAVGAIQNDMLALTRVPGIGSQSDLEAKIANLKYPSIYNHPSVNAANIKQLKAFMEDLRNQITGQSENQQGGGTRPPAGQRTVVRTGTSNGRKVIQYSDGSVEYGN